MDGRWSWYGLKFSPLQLGIMSFLYILHMDSDADYILKCSNPGSARLVSQDESGVILA
jgi:hypothetical protein